MRKLGYVVFAALWLYILWLGHHAGVSGHVNWDAVTHMFYLFLSSIGVFVVTRDRSIRKSSGLIVLGLFLLGLSVDLIKSALALRFEVSSPWTLSISRIKGAISVVPAVIALFGAFLAFWHGIRRRAREQHMPDIRRLYQGTGV